MSFTFRQAEPALRDLITSYYSIAIAGPSGEGFEDLLHPEWGNLRLQLENEWDAMDGADRPLRAPPASLFGPTSRARRVVAGAGLLQGIGFTPLGWALLIGCPADRLADEVVDAQPLLGPKLATLQKELRTDHCVDRRKDRLDAFFAGRVLRHPARESVIRAIHAAMLDPAVRTVEQFAAQSGLSSVALARACQRDFGFTPKLLLQRQRFLRTLAALGSESGPIGELIDAAYVDHSHFNRDFKRFMGLTPTEYLAQPRLILRAATGARERAIGAALQGLHELTGGTAPRATG